MLRAFHKCLQGGNITCAEILLISPVRPPPGSSSSKVPARKHTPGRSERKLQTIAHKPTQKDQPVLTPNFCYCCVWACKTPALASLSSPAATFLKPCPIKPFHSVFQELFGEACPSAESCWNLPLTANLLPQNTPSKALY